MPAGLDAGLSRFHAVLVYVQAWLLEIFLHFYSTVTSHHNGLFYSLFLGNVTFKYRFIYQITSANLKML